MRLKVEQVMTRITSPCPGTCECTGKKEFVRVGMELGEGGMITSKESPRVGNLPTADRVTD